MNNRDILKGQLGSLVCSMRAEGGPFFLPDLIPKFMQQTHATIEKLSEALEVAAVNLTSIHTDCVRIKSCTESFGAGKLGLASSDLYHGVVNGDREACVLAVAKLREEQPVLFCKLEEVVELESRIITHDGH